MKVPTQSQRATRGGIMLTLGSLLWLGSWLYFRNVLIDANTGYTLVTRFNAIDAHTVEWITQHGMYMVGMALVSFGLGQITMMLKGTPGWRPGLFAVFAIFWAAIACGVVIALLIVMPTSGIESQYDLTAFQISAISGGQHFVFIALTLIALWIYGLAMVIGRLLLPYGIIMMIASLGLLMTQFSIAPTPARYIFFITLPLGVLLLAMRNRFQSTAHSNATNSTL